jgi:hypothetical protein
MTAAVIDLEIEPIWKSVPPPIGVRTSALAKPKSRTVVKPFGIVKPSVRPGTEKKRRWASA